MLLGVAGGRYGTAAVFTIHHSHVAFLIRKSTFTGLFFAVLQPENAYMGCAHLQASY
jgi:hypothetical protein